MKKRIISWILVISMLLSLCMPIYAGGIDNKQPTSAYGNKMIEYLLADNHKLLTIRNNYSYMQFADRLRQDAWSLYLFEMTDLLIQTGTEPDRSKYIEVLINIIGTYELDNAADISAQKSMDNLKSVEDYAMDIVDIGTNAVSVMVGTNKEVSKFEDAISTAIGRISTLKGNIDNWVDALSDLETIVEDYSKHDEFLELIEKKSDGELKKAASILRSGMSKAFMMKLDTYADVSDKNCQNYGEMFFTDIFWETLRQTQDYENDKTFKEFVDAGEGFVSKVEYIKDSWELALGIGKLVGNVVVGGEDLINRVLEIFALADISAILQLETTELANDFLEELGTTKETEKIDKYKILAKYLIGSRIRGEYCLYSIVANDAGLLSWFNKESSEQAKDWYEAKARKILNIQAELLKVRREEETKVDVEETRVISEDELRTILLNNVSEPIVNFIYDDFDNDGVYEGIAFCGEYNDSYFGTLYFVTQNGVQIMRAKDRYWNCGVVYDFGDTKIVSIDKYFTTGAISYCYKINGMEFKEIEGSGFGNMYQDEQGHIYMTDSQYDATVDGTGHTWNIYYFYWDAGLWEYGGTEISIEEFSKYSGASSILDKITIDGYNITSIYKRGNNIININCCDGYNNVNLRVMLENNNVQVFQGGEETFSYEAGIIKPALVPQIAIYSQ